MDLNDYIKQTELADAPPGPASKVLQGVEAVAEDETKDMKAAVDAGSVVSFVDGLDAQEKDDVLFSTQFAQRAASAKANRFLEVGRWYRLYVDWLDTLGWVGARFGMNEYQLQESDMKMDAAVLEIIAAVATGGQSAILQKTLAALGGLADDSKQITVFEFHSSNNFAANFQMSAVQKSDSGALSVALGAFRYRTDKNRKKFLFFKWGKQHINFWAGSQSLTFNRTLYSQVRDDVAEALGANARKLIAGVKL